MEDDENVKMDEALGAFENGDYDKALQLYSSIIGANHPMIAEIYKQKAANYLESGNYDLAIESLQNALGITPHNTPEYAEYCMCMVKVYHSKDDYNNSEYFLHEALNTIQNCTDINNDLYFGIYNSIGVLSAAQGDKSKALENYIKALYYKNEESSERACVYHNIGIIYGRKENFDEAIRYISDALETLKKIESKDYNSYILYLTDLGDTYEKKGEYQKSINYLIEAKELQIKRIGEGNPFLGKIYNILGSVYLKINKREEAIQYLNDALKIQKKTLNENHPQNAKTYSLLSEFYDDEDYNKSTMYSEQAFSIYKETKLYQEIIDNSFQLGSNYFHLKKYPEAEKYFLRSIEIIEEVRRSNLSGGKEFVSRNIDSYYYAISIFYIFKDYNTLFNLSERMLSLTHLERLSVKSLISSNSINQRKINDLIEYENKINSLTTQREKIISLPILEMTAQEKQKYLGKLTELSDQLKQAETEFARLDNEILKEPKYRNYRKPDIITLDAIQNLCASDLVIFEYIIPPEERKDIEIFPLLLIISKEKFHVVELDKNYHFYSKTNEFRDSIYNTQLQNDSENVNTLAIELYNMLIQPAANIIDIEKFKSLVIIPDGILAFLPFDALKVNNDKYLAEMFEISLSPSASVYAMIQQRNFTCNKSIAAFDGGIYSESDNKESNKKRSVSKMLTYDEMKIVADNCLSTPAEYYRKCVGEFDPIPKARDEVNKIAEIFSGKNPFIVTGKDVTEKKIKQLSNDNKLLDYSCIHFACHGHYEPEFPFYSALIFSEATGKINESNEDGYLTVSEAAALNLQSEIVVLSACSTGIGEFKSGDGVTGLARAFQVAGAKRVLVSLWDISDEATMKFMINFYSHVKENLSFRDAFIKTKQEFRKIPKYGAPYYWSGFVLYE